MIRRIVAHEWRRLRRDPALWIGLGLLAGLIVFAAWNGATSHAERTADVTALLDEAEAGLAAQRTAAAEGAAGVPGQARTVAALPPGPLADLTAGVAALHPNHARVSAWTRIDTLFRRYQIESPWSLMAGRFDLTFVVIYLLPLLILGLSYDLLSDEREQGTLPMVLAQPTSLRALLAGKVVARLLAVVAPVLALCALAALASAPPSPDRLARLGLWLTVTLAYTLFWLALATAVAVRGWRSETGAAASLCLWLVLVLVVPGVLHLTIDAAVPAPSRFEFVSTMRQAANEAQKESAELLARFYHEHPELAPEEEQGGFPPRLFTTQREVERRVAPLVTGFDRSLEERHAWTGYLRFASPSLVAVEGLEEVAGTGLRRQRRFVEQARSFLDAWRGALRAKIYRGDGLTPDDYDALPRFAFEEADRHLVPRAAVAVLALLIPAALLALWASTRLDRYPVVGR